MTTQHSENEDTYSPTAEDPPELQEQKRREQEEEREHKLDEAIEMTFPASDPLAI